MKTSKIMKALLVFGMSMVTATAVIGFTACGDDHEHVDADNNGKCDICEIVMTTDGQEENKGGDDKGEEKPAPKTTVTAAEWKEIIENANNYTYVETHEDYSLEVKIDGDKFELTDTDEEYPDHHIIVKNGENYDVYYEVEGQWVKSTYTAEQAADAYLAEQMGFYQGILKLCKDDFGSFEYDNGKYTAETLDKTDTIDIVLENVEVTFSDGKLVGVKFSYKTDPPQDDTNFEPVEGAPAEQAEDPTEGNGETTETTDPTEGNGETTVIPGPTEDPTEDPVEQVIVPCEIKSVGSTEVKVPTVGGEANVLGTYYTYWLGDDGWKYGDGEDIVVKDDGTCVVDGDPATYVVDENGIVNVNDGEIYAKMEEKFLWLFNTAADADDYANAIGFAYNGTEISAEDKEKVEKITGKGFVTEGGETPGPGIDLGAYVGTYYSYWPGVEEAVWEYGFDIVVKDDGTCLVDGVEKTYVVDENGVVNVDDGFVYAKIEDKIMWLYKKIDSVGYYANAMGFAYKGSNEIPAEVKLMIEKITGKGFATEDPNPNPNPPIVLSAYAGEPIYGEVHDPDSDYIYHHIYLSDEASKQYDFDNYTATVKVDGTDSDYASCQAFSAAEIKDHSYHMRVRVKANRYQTVEITISFMKGGEVVATGIYTRVGDKEISLSDSTLSLTLAEDGSTVTETLTVTLKNVEGTVEWSIDDDSVATVTDNGDGTATVTAVAAGKATITVSVEGATPKTCKVEVLNPGETGTVTQLTARLEGEPYNEHYMKFILDQDMGAMGGDSFDGLRINGTTQTWIERVGPWAGGGIAYNFFVGDITLSSYHVEFLKNDKVVAEFTYTVVAEET